MIVPIPVEVSPIGVKHTERRLQQLGAEHDDPQPPRRLTLSDRRRQQDHRLPVRRPSTTPGLSIDSSSASPAFSKPGLFLDLCDTLIVGTDERRRAVREPRAQPGLIDAGRRCPVDLEEIRPLVERFSVRAST